MRPRPSCFLEGQGNFWFFRLVEHACFALEHLPVPRAIGVVFGKERFLKDAEAADRSLWVVSRIGFKNAEASSFFFSAG
jgi:hypothetical protein